MSNKLCLGSPAGASWHSVKGYPSVEAKSPRSDITMIHAPRPLSLPKAHQPSKSLANRVGKMKPPKRFNKPVGRKSWRDITLGDGADYGYKAWMLAKKIATLVNVEEKVHDVDGSAGVTVTSGGSVINLSNIAQGTDYFNRVGDSILGQSMQLTATIRGNTSTASHRLRVLLVSDKEQNGTDPTFGELLQGGTSPITQPYNLFYEQRFNVLYDEVFVINNVIGLATGGTSSGFIAEQLIAPSLDRKWNKHVLYDATAAADASNRENALYLMLISDDAANGPVFLYNFRFRFTDN
jgi:hypothetical protein